MENKKIQSFKDLRAWQEGHVLVLNVYRMTRQFPKDEVFAITSQMRRAAVSVTSNIAEGFSRQSLKEKVQFYSMAQGSLTELQNQMLISRDVGYLGADDFQRSDDLSVSVHKILTGLIKSSRRFLSSKSGFLSLTSYFLLLTSLFLTSYFLLPSSSFAAVLTTPPTNLGLVGYWSFDEGTSTTAGDFSSNKNIGTFVGNTTWANGKHGKAVTFDGSGDYVVTQKNLTLGNTFTVTAWVNPDAGNGGFARIAETLYTTGFYLGGDLNTTKFQWIVKNAVYPFGGVIGGTVKSGKWTFVVGTYDGTTGILYVDGANVSSNTFTAPGTVSRKLYIGIAASDQSSNPWKGKIDNVRIYSRALSAAEILALYKSGEAKVNAPTANPNLMSGLVGWWTLDGKDITDKVYDMSGQGNNGYIYNTATSSAKVVGKLGQALNFNKASSMVSMGDPSNGSLDMGVSDFSLSAWTKLKDDDTIDWIVGKGNGAGAGTIGYDLLFRGDVAGNPLYFRLGSDSYQTVNSGATSVGNGLWHHIVATADRDGNAEIWIDGVRSVSTSINSAPANGNIDNSTIFSIGRRGASDLWQANGSIDDVRVYNRALSATEVSALYRSGAAKVNAPETSRLTDGLVGYWTFDGPDITTTVTDRSGNGNSGYIYNVSTSSAKTIGKVGQALKFDGADDYVNTSDIAAMDSQSAFTVSAWVKSNALALNQEIAGKYDTGLGTGLLFQTGSSAGTGGIDDIAFGFQGSHFVYTTGGFLSNNKWVHVVGVFDNALGTSKHKIYIDGESRSVTNNGSPDNVTSTGASGSPFNIGRLNSDLSRYWKGSIDEVRIYNRALSAAEVKQLYLMGK